MFNTLYILQWENYYSRRVHPDLVNYEDGGYGIYLEMDTAGFSGVNFNPNDGVNTEVILNFNETQKGNYLIVLNEDKRIESRWFIIDENRVRGNQYKLTLRRDVITDYWNIIKSSPALIEKCNLDYDDKLIFNSEDMTVNQIKTNETLLKDITGCPWLVAYIAKDLSKIEDAQLSGNASTSEVNPNTIPINEPIDSWMDTHETYYGEYTELAYLVHCAYQDEPTYKINADSGEVGYGITRVYDTGITERNSAYAGYVYKRAVKNGFKPRLAQLKNEVPAYLTDYHTQAEVDEFLSLNGRLIKDTNQEVYRVSIEQVKASSKYYDVGAGALFNTLTDAVRASKTTVWGVEFKAFGSAGNTVNPNSKAFQVYANYNTYKTTITRVASENVKYDISATRQPTLDAAYDILAVPYGAVDITIIGSGDTFTTKADIGISTIQSLAKNLGLGCYDIQLVPYCPVLDMAIANKFYMSNNLDYSLIKQGEGADETNVGIIFNVPKANFSTNVSYSIPASQTSIQRKINNDCDKWRLCSPNFSNYFDFSVEKNNGVQHFNVDCCYKPYSPYIHINPNFNGLYGQDWNDPRGLVCGGDFSLTQVQDRWIDYQLQNKNFQATFDRQIQNMEITNKYQKAADMASAIAGTLQGGVSGGATGLMASGGNPAAAAIGGAVGVLGSGITGAADVIINEKLRNEALDYTKDQFGYQLGNIQAIPLTLTKVSAFNDNNKIFPVLEYYTCTDREKEAFANKIAYNGMTNMTIGTVESVANNNWEIEINNKTIKSQNYIKAKPIYLDLGEDFHIANTIAKEMNMGFYIVEEDE